MSRLRFFNVVISFVIFVIEFYTNFALPFYPIIIIIIVNVCRWVIIIIYFFVLLYCCFFYVPPPLPHLYPLPLRTDWFNCSDCCLRKHSCTVYFVGVFALDCSFISCEFYITSTRFSRPPLNIFFSPLPSHPPPHQQKYLEAGQRVANALKEINTNLCSKVFVIADFERQTSLRDFVRRNYGGTLSCLPPLSKYYKASNECERPFNAYLQVYLKPYNKRKQKSAVVVHTSLIF